MEAVEEFVVVVSQPGYLPEAEPGHYAEALEAYYALEADIVRSLGLCCTAEITDPGMQEALNDAYQALDNGEADIIIYAGGYVHTVTYGD